MCGIAGILTFNGRPVLVEDVSSLTNMISHRGLDYASHLVGGDKPGSISQYPGVGIGHRRLSIIDLAEHSSQPMRSQNSKSTIVYNGELYNYRKLRDELLLEGYRFATESDTEVVLASYDAWGEDCLKRFNGMFAFAIWDEADGSLFCARDPIGIKPFYFSYNTEHFAFASESQALTKLCGKKLDSKSIASYFLSMYVPGDLSIYSGIEKLLPGHAMRISYKGDKKIWQYWKIPSSSRSNISVEDAADELNERMDLAVKSQLQSDVPVGAFLSGGFDSGMILSSAAKSGIPIHTYSVGFDDVNQESELPTARSMSQRYQTIHHERIIAGDEVIGMLDKAIASMSEPVADSAMVPTYCLAGMAADNGVKVLLSGAGGDEVFAGYSRYVATTPQRRLLLSLPKVLRNALGSKIFPNSLLANRLSHSSLDMILCAGGAPSLTRDLFGNDKNYVSFIKELIDSKMPKSTRHDDRLYEDMSFDLQVYLPDLLLMTLDQLTMAHTVEGRVPLLDVDLIAASYSLPSSYHASKSSSITRQLMRRMAVGRVDERTFSSSKLGFSGPVVSWINSNKSTFKDVIMAARELPMVRNIPIEERWLAGVNNPTKAWAMEMFTIYCFTKWCQTHA